MLFKVKSLNLRLQAQKIHLYLKMDTRDCSCWTCATETFASSRNSEGIGGKKEKILTLIAKICSRVFYSAPHMAHVFSLFYLQLWFLLLSLSLLSSKYFHFLVRSILGQEDFSNRAVRVVEGNHPMLTAHSAFLKLLLLK